MDEPPHSAGWAPRRLRLARTGHFDCMDEEMNVGVDRGKGEQMSPEQSILERLYALERENRMMKRIGLIVIVIAASLLLTAQAPGKRTIEANEIILRDSSGIVRSKWFMT